ncbi:DUF977 family protein [Klebsiella variicola]|nr:DUF977 family protein [Klebsiella variicola]
MTKRTQLHKVRDVRRIIDFVKEHGRITTEQVAEMTGLSIKTARLDMQVAQRTGGDHPPWSSGLIPRSSCCY